MLLLFSSIQSDWNRYLRLHKKYRIFLFLFIFFHNPGMFFSLIYRIEYYLFHYRLLPVRYIGYICYPFYFLLTYYILDIHISPRVAIGKGLYIHNRGIIIADSMKAGENLTLIGPLTVGYKGFGEGEKAATIGRNVVIYSGAKVIGDVRIGNNVHIGANAVVIKDVPPHSTAVGIPARIIERRHEK